MTSCASPNQDLPAQNINPDATVIEGLITLGGVAHKGAYVRLHDSNGEFTAEVVTGENGTYRFYAAPGNWEIRVLSSKGNANTTLFANPGTNQGDLELN